MGSVEELVPFSFLMQLKKYMEKHKGVAEFAREELAKYQLPDSFSPPYNPRLATGSFDCPLSITCVIGLPCYNHNTE